MMHKFDLLHKAKDFHIAVHKTVSISLMGIHFIDNKYFQRLRKLKQLGTCDYIYSSSNHSRFEHSIGTYHLADKLVTRIQSDSPPDKLEKWLKEVPELKSHYASGNVIGFSDWIMELIKIAALLHDIGHGPYSHIYDDSFIKESDLKDHEFATHEARSCEFVRMIVDENKVLSEFMTDDDVRFIQTVIDPPEGRDGFVYQIVSNNLNGLDVDKYDYIKRDSHHNSIEHAFEPSRLIDAVLVVDNKIVYQEQALHSVLRLYHDRHAMHRTMYGHKGVVSAHYIITNIMHILDKTLKISESILDLNQFVKLTDEYILNYGKIIIDNKDLFSDKLSESELNKLKELLDRLDTHNLYPHIGTILTDKLIDIGSRFDTDEYIIYKNKIGFVSGDKSNPLDRIYVYKTKDRFKNGADVTIRRIKKNEITYIIPAIYQEYVTMVFRKDRITAEIIKDKADFKKISNELYVT